MRKEKSAFDRIAEVMQDQELAFHELGPVWGSPPRLFEAKRSPGQAVHAAVQTLLDHIESRGCHASEVRAILAACQMGTDRVITPSAALFGLSPELLGHVLRVFAWVTATGGLSLDDFEDGGQRFLRLVHRKRGTATRASTDKVGA